MVYQLMYGWFKCAEQLSIGSYLRDILHARDNFRSKMNH